MLASRITSVFLLTVFFGKIDGVLVSVSDGESEQDELTCCDIGNHSMVYALTNITNNGVIKVTMDVVLPSIIILEDLENITIVGQRNTSINCRSVGAVKFISCSNVTIIGINWIGCGSKNNPVIEFYNSSNTTIQDSSFHNSTGQAIVLSEVSSNVNISNCEFTHNSEHQGHGAAIHFSSQNHTQLHFVIDSCNFSFNGAADSLVYIDGPVNRLDNFLFVQDCVFIQNRGVPIYVSHHRLHLNGKLLFQQNRATAGGGIFAINSIVTFDNKADVSFINNSALSYGGAIYLTDSRISFEENTVVNLKENKAKTLGGAIYSVSNSEILFNRNTIVLFHKNRAGAFGGALYSQKQSTITFDEESNVTFTGNVASISGGAILSHYHCRISFSNNSEVTFNDNRAESGGAVYSASHSAMSFNGNSNVAFSGNDVRERGGAIDSFDRCNITFNENSLVTFKGNKATYGGAMRSARYSIISFNAKSTVKFEYNDASNGGGGGIDSKNNCDIIFDANSAVTFKGNSATKGGGLQSVGFSSVLISANTSLIFEGNRATYGGALSSDSYSEILFLETSTVILTDNSGTLGGALYTDKYSNVLFGGNASVTFSDNDAIHGGGAIFCYKFCSLLFGQHSVTAFSNNMAQQNGGALFSYDNITILFDGKSKVLFNRNSAVNGGAVQLEVYGNISFDGDTDVTFKENKASDNGGAVFSYKNCYIVIDGNSLVTFIGNNATTGGALVSRDNSNMSVDGNANLMFSHNSAILNGGAVHCGTESQLKFNGNSITSFYHNIAEHDGGAMHCNDHSDVILEAYVRVTFTNNTAENGGAIAILQSNLIFRMNSSTIFNNNLALRDGGALYLSNGFNVTFKDDSDVIFLHNNAEFHGGAIYGELINSIQSTVSNTTDIDLQNNTALVGPDAYIDVPGSCDEYCFGNSIAGLKVTHNNPPRKLAFYDPATCIDDDNKTCKTYYISNVMLGQDITIDACVLGFNDQTAGSVDFVVSSKDQEYKIDGRFVSVACKEFQGVGVTGKRISNRTNFTMTIASYVSSQSEISITLIMELSPCHPGFYYNDSTETCICYNDVVSCSGGTSMIKRGYWFGLVNNKSTVSICPLNYCNFTSSETSNGFYQLSPMRTNQCMSQRSGTACGSCSENYTLSFDSVECVSVDKCTTSQTILAITLSMLYWVVIVMIVFIMTYYHVGVGYLYAITYYYSVLDILLNQNLHISQRLHMTISIISSIVKVTPQFLGKLCLVRNMSGIDQQFIHYIHPLAVTLIVAIICQSARISHKFSAFISRGIIHVVCFLFLLSYTSVATTSLLLLRSLTFDNVDKVYTYLSPDIEYFNGRHLPYFIVSLLCALVIVIGLPVLLLFEPFLNHKINFTSIKPLLDQFQGCYKDKYRCFAAYYMICRLIIISIIISNGNNTQYLLITASTLLALIQLILKPYESELLNVFDGMVLQLIILISMIPLVDSFDPLFLSAITIVLVVLPLVSFVVMELLVYKETIKKLTTYCRHKPSNSPSVVSVSDIGIIVDENMRRNATVCEM